MKSGKPKPAPKVAPPSRAKPNYMKESSPKSVRKSPMAPMTGKKLSK